MTAVPEEEARALCRCTRDPGNTTGFAASHDCTFCTNSDTRIRHASKRCLAIEDAHPLSKGHTLVVPRKHVKSIFELGGRDIKDLWDLVQHVRTSLTEEYSPSGITVGINDGEGAGQTVDHGHVHIIPRYEGDVRDPRGGVRWILPHKAEYWKPSSREPQEIAASLIAYAFHDARPDKTKVAIRAGLKVLGRELIAQSRRLRRPRSTARRDSALL